MPKSTNTRDSLNKRLRDEVRGISGPTLRPAEKTPPEPGEDTGPFDLKELGLPLPIQNRIATITTECWNLGQERKGLEKQEESLRMRLKELLVEHLGTEKVSFRANGIPVSQFTVPRKTLSAPLLREHGVSQEILDACTKVTDVLTLRIGGGKEQP